ncbi:MAG TPA: thioredoxin domain-containing protein [Alphaproteobacteria bacterium]|nr:thioredoxin domain-containing protein [Alphaproteobacteria bacterium]HNS45095.1 thioredoxin domain-containing protein [Alphaproteobacteria bacterium]
MSDQQPKSKKHFHYLTAAVFVAVAAYFILVPSKKSGDTTVTPPAITVSEEPAQEDLPPQPDAQTQEVTKDDIVVETKSLSMPTSGEQEVAPAPVVEEKTAYDPSIAAMMAPRIVGSNDAPIKVTEYSSLTCGHCGAFLKDEFQKIKEAYIDTGKVQFTFKEYPLNEPAVIASQVLRCMPEDKFVGFQDLLFEQQESWAYVPDFQDKLIQYAKLAGMGEDTVKACIANVELKKAIIGDMQTANEKFKIASTPTFVVNGGEKIIVGHQPFSFFQESFDALLAGKSAPEPEKAAE